MPKTVHERTAEGGKEARRAERGDRVNILAYLFMAGCTFMSVTAKELGWGYLAGAALMLALLWRSERRWRRPDTGPPRLARQPVRGGVPSDAPASSPAPPTTPT